MEVKTSLYSNKFSLSFHFIEHNQITSLALNLNDANFNYLFHET